MPPPAAADPEIAAVLRALRESQGRSQEELAHDAGITVTSLARIERAQVNPTWTSVRGIVNGLGISFAEFGQALDARQAT